MDRCLFLKENQPAVNMWRIIFKNDALKTLLAATLGCLCATGQLAVRNPIEIRIEGFKRTSSGYEAVVVVRNVSSQLFVFAEGGDKPGALQSLDIQRWDKKLGWQSVGPRRDLTPTSTVKLNPGQSLQNTVPIHVHAGGKVRAILYFAYESEEKFRNRDRKGRVDVVSSPIDLPAAK
jgi:hypothetical protein